MCTHTNTRLITPRHVLTHIKTLVHSHHNTRSFKPNMGSFAPKHALGHTKTRFRSHHNTCSVRPKPTAHLQEGAHGGVWRLPQNILLRRPFTARCSQPYDAMPATPHLLHVWTVRRIHRVHWTVVPDSAYICSCWMFFLLLFFSFPLHQATKRLVSLRGVRCVMYLPKNSSTTIWY